ncbi:glycosyltransferase family 2 protein [Granulicella sp. S190]|uniref:glycosyltransferase family 2 protein n=1 Tax=Granulicella sp. S190 TaxID=1747226 RepID=UPI00131EA48C|nr:glycosyltransferase family 2 protein [Granulicella sp. S190]
MEVRTAKPSLATLAVQTWLFFLRHETKFTKLHLTRLRRRNETSKLSAVASGGPVVSVTTYGERLRSVHLVLESIAAGSMLPSRLILWVDHEEALNNLTPGLKRLVARGLEIRLSENFGPHTKYYPYLLSTDNFDCALVTADDDLLYSRWWLKGLVRSYDDNSEVVNCYRAHRVGFEGASLSPYQTWEPCRSTDPSFLHFATGVSGCIYPPSLLKKLKAAGSEFMQLCPKADDVWLHANALRAGMKTRQIWNRPLRFPFVPGTQDSGLYHSNVLQSRNDDQIRKTYTEHDLGELKSAAVLADQR